MVPENDCSHCKKLLSYVQMKPFPVQLLCTAICHLCMVPCEEGVSVTFVVILKLVGYCDELPTETSLPREKRLISFSLSS